MLCIMPSCGSAICKAGACLARLLTVCLAFLPSLAAHLASYLLACMAQVEEAWAQQDVSSWPSIDVEKAKTRERRPRKDNVAVASKQVLGFLCSSMAGLSVLVLSGFASESSSLNAFPHLVFTSSFLCSSLMLLRMGKSWASTPW